MKIPKDIFEKALAIASDDTAGRRQDAPFLPEQFTLKGQKPTKREKVTVEIKVSPDFPTIMELDAQHLSKIKRDLRHRSQTMPPSLQRRRIKQQIRDVDAVLRAMFDAVEATSPTDQDRSEKRYAR
ncbi:hypothetical protein [Rhizobium sp. C4]|uniref:hypothetical protein n=1 Tax=Rhizobium sp. C4 TaxID=1349800 RepID=UPI001E355D37|nr:hypothetical protein [Rhizobium sp. C4]MCD2171806.1 hypothetical protein [Rhizobium sp. C4]